jgi:hypothetical protein
MSYETVTIHELIAKMKLVVQKHSKIAGWIAKILPLLLAVAFVAPFVWFAVWLTGSKWLGVPLGFILGMCLLIGTLILLINAYDKLIIPILRRRERRRRSLAENCGRYGDPSCER